MLIDLDPLLDMRLHRHIPSRRGSPRTVLRSHPVHPLHKARLCPNPRPDAPRTNIRHDTTRDDRSMDSVLRRRSRLPHEICIEDAALV